MKKMDMIRKVSEISECTHKDVEAVINAFAEVIGETLREDTDDRVVFPGVGTFKVKEIPAREGIVHFGQKKGQKWFHPAHKEIVFVPSSSFKKIDEE